MTKKELENNNLNLTCIICGSKMKPEKTYSLERNLKRKYCSPKCSFIGQGKEGHPWRPVKRDKNGR